MRFNAIHILLCLLSSGLPKRFLFYILSFQDSKTSKIQSRIDRNTC